ncbi:DUF2000 domain-containing protein [Natronospirillum operosum]|uniref:DUF2000 domain-containing protein n=1 Tax=Natronospirillum operosum TaxID=2759953 RepID=A0A4Z0W7A2_9GAMM|nr:DUF2000 domain-containing protein [Natronospirillum operosum]TGG93247.1 DUF2000 domain-containing protein [Natronospirillum operosum]
MSTKTVIVLADNLPAGLVANFAAVLGMSLGKHFPDLVGDDTVSADGVQLKGITKVPLPVLGAPGGDLPDLFLAAAELPLRCAYMRAAFEASDYADYTLRINSASLAAQIPQGLLLAGPRKAVDRLCGRLPLLR